MEFSRRVARLLLFMKIMVCPQMELVNGDVECQQKYYLERYQKAVVSCVYERDFHTVRWYFSGTDTSFLRIDGSKKSGSGYLSGEYDIEDDGSMVIKAVNIQHERNYTISILHVDGSSSKAETMILVKVTLEDLDVFDCGMSPAVCKENRLEDKTAVMCIARNTRPAAILTFFSYNGSSLLPVHHPINFTTHFNETTQLFTSIATFKYLKIGSRLTFFTCVATGPPVSEVTNKSCLVERDISFSKISSEEKYVNSGEIFHITCPRNNKSAGRLKKISTDGTKEIVMDAWPIEGHYECSEHFNCEIVDQSEVALRNFTFKQEGSFECISSDESGTTKHSIHLKVLIMPTTPGITVDGCEEHCQQNVSVRGEGVINCTINGARPPIAIEIHTGPESTGMRILNKKNSIIDHPSTGTFDTTLSVEYILQSCTIAEVTCLPLPHTSGRQIKSTKVELLPQSKCSSHAGKGGVIAVGMVMVLLVVFIVPVAVLGYLQLRKKDTSITRCRCTRRSHENTAVRFTKETGDSTDAYHSESEPMLSKTFETSFLKFYKKCQNQKATEKNLQTLLDDSKHNRKEFLEYLRTFIRRKETDNKAVVHMMNLFVSITPKQEGINLLRTAGKVHQLSDEEYLETIGKMLSSKQITMQDYVIISSPLLATKKISFKKLMENAKKMCTDEKELAVDISFDKINQMLLSHKIKCEEYFQIVTSLLENDGLPVDTYFGAINNMLTIQQINVEEYAMITIPLLQIKKLPVERYINTVNEQFASQKITVQDYCYLTTDLLRKNYMEFADIKNVLTKYFTRDDKWKEVEDILENYHNNELISPKFYLEIAGVILSSGKISIEQYTVVTRHLVSRKEITFDELQRDIMKSAAKGNKHKKKEITDALLNYYILGVTQSEFTFENICFHKSEKKIPYTYLLQSIHECIRKNAEQEKSIALLKELLQKALLNEEEFMDRLIRSLENNMDITRTFLQVLIFSFCKEKISENDFLAILEHSLEEKVLEKDDYHKTVLSSLTETWMDADVCMNLLHISLKESFISDGIYSAVFQHLAKDRKIKFRDKKDELQKIKEEKLMSDNVFEQLLVVYIRSDAWNKENWIRYVATAYVNKLIKDDTTMKLMDEIIQSYKVSKFEMKDILDRSGIMDKETRATFTHNMKF